MGSALFTQQAIAGFDRMGARARTIALVASTGVAIVGARSGCWQRGIGGLALLGNATKAVIAGISGILRCALAADYAVVCGNGIDSTNARRADLFRAGKRRAVAIGSVWPGAPRMAARRWIADGARLVWIDGTGGVALGTDLAASGIRASIRDTPRPVPADTLNAERDSRTRIGLVREIA